MLHQTSNPDFDLVTSVMKRRLSYAGHILRMDQDRIPRRTFIASNINNSKHHPAESILHGYEKQTMCGMIQLAQNRRAWSRFVDSLNLLQLTTYVALHLSNTVHCVQCNSHIHITSKYRFHGDTRLEYSPILHAMSRINFQMQFPFENAFASNHLFYD